MKTWFQNRRAKWRRSVAGGGSGGVQLRPADGVLHNLHHPNPNDPNRFNNNNNNAVAMEAYKCSPPLNLRRDNHHVVVDASREAAGSQHRMNSDLNEADNDTRLDDEDVSEDGDDSDDFDRPDTPINIV